MTKTQHPACGPLHFTSTATLAVLMAISFAFPAVAPAGEGPCAQSVTGTYLSSIVDANGNLLSRAILTFHSDGTLQSIDSNQAGIPGQFNPFTENAGEWACTGRDSVTATAISFALPGTEGSVSTLARNDFNVRVNRHTKRLEGTVELIFFPLTADPFHDAGSSAGVFRFTALPVVLKAH